MEYNYADTIEELKANAKVPVGDIFEYEFSEIKDIYQLYFQFFLLCWSSRKMKEPFVGVERGKVRLLHQQNKLNETPSLN